MSAEILHLVGVKDAPNRIRELRMKNGFSQQRLADAIGVSKVTISDLERDNMQLTQEYMRRLSVPLNCTPADLLPIVENPYLLSDEERQMIDRMRHARQEERDQLEKLADVVIPWKGKAAESDAA